MNLSCDRLHSIDEDASDVLRDGWHYGVSEASQAVHTAGNPISHSTHVGFNIPPTSFASWRPWCTCRGECVRGCAVGVGHSVTKSHNVVPLFPVDPCPPFAVRFRLFRLSPTVAVGHNPCRAMCVSDGRTFAPELGDWFVP
jgi:hypothetical protein